VPGGEEVMPERRIVHSKDKIEFLETWKEEKHDHLQKEGIFNGEDTHR
jgi:alkylated DNA nucleotide flippase Atl1